MPESREDLLSGTYKPLPVRPKKIPKPDGIKPGALCNLLGLVGFHYISSWLVGMFLDMIDRQLDLEAAVIEQMLNHRFKHK